jgi:orotate phosphoribosyltransferase
VVIVDDVATTGGSSLKAVDAVEAMGCRVARVICVLDRLEGAAEAFRDRGLPFSALCTIRDLGIEPLPPENAAAAVPYHPDVDPLPPLQGP